MYIPKLNEEEARFLALRFLSQSPKRQGSIEQIRNSIRKSREMGKDDLRPNPTRSNAPFWHQIVQNATDRTILDQGYVVMVVPPPNKIVRITDAGLDAVKPQLEFFDHHPGVATYTMFDDTMLEDLYMRNRAKLPFRNARNMADFVKSRAFASLTRSDLEAKGFATTILDGLENKFRSIDGPVSEEAAFRLRQIQTWRVTRDTYDPTAGLADRLAQLSSGPSKL
ncbi:hypothetical protein [Rhizobium sp. BK176]|uniref:hypothetical protein n=1 Tax=Rhizobium sp. BK176 TaxID=2587071 RepID=UPI0021694CA0|nr:hypothetical protein [Rhizobium sp. BK176]MCS4089235.1 hypothetical protein [Rhizobium sp. BK176]